jgi:endonuclease YncB( thermonuclease family)
MGIADRDYMRERKLRWDDARGEMRLDDRGPPRPPGSGSWRGWLAIVLAVVGLGGAGWWWSRSSGPQVPPVVVSPPPQEVPQAPQNNAPAADAENPVLVGAVIKVVDGDTIDVQLDSGPIRVRLGSIDAPEHNQPWGREAKAALTRKLGHQEVALDVVEQTEQYGRMVAVVYLGDENIDEWMVQQGNAWAYRQYLEDPQYCNWEVAARSEGRGLWALPRGETHAPWEWRSMQRHRSKGFTDYTNETAQDCIDDMHRAKQHAKEHSAPPPPAAQAPGNSKSAAAAADCRIKGNISSRGKIYHVPGSANYDRTVIDPSKGERMFCTEAEAQAAGWRAPKN